MGAAVVGAGVRDGTGDEKTADGVTVGAAVVGAGVRDGTEVITGG